MIFIVSIQLYILFSLCEACRLLHKENIKSDHHTVSEANKWSVFYCKFINMPILIYIKIPLFYK